MVLSIQKVLGAMARNICHQEEKSSHTPNTYVLQYLKHNLLQQKEIHLAHHLWALHSYCQFLKSYLNTHLQAKSLRMHLYSKNICFLSWRTCSSSPRFSCYSFMLLVQDETLKTSANIYVYVFRGGEERWLMPL